MSTATIMQYILRDSRPRIAEHDALDNILDRTGILELDAHWDLSGDGECRRLPATRLLDFGGCLGDPGFAGVGADRCLGGAGGATG